MLTPPTPYLASERLGLEPLRIFHAASMIKLLPGRPGYEEARGDWPTYELLTREYTMLVAGSRHETEQWHNWILRPRAVDKYHRHRRGSEPADLGSPGRTGRFTFILKEPTRRRLLHHG